MIVYKLLVLDKNTWNHATVCELFILDKNTWYTNCVQTNDYRQAKKCSIMITIKYVQINQISVLNNPYGVDMPLNKTNQTKSSTQRTNFFLIKCL